MNVLIAGGGVAALEALLALRDLAGDRVDVQFIAPKPRTDYRPLAVTESFGIGRPRSYELEPIARDLGATLYEGALAEVRAGKRQAISRDGGVLDYDALLVAVGGRPGIGLPGAVSVTGPGFTGRFKGVLGELEDGRTKKLVFAVPAGPAWVLPLYELALLTSQLVADRGLAVQVALVTPESRPLELLGSEASAEVQRLLDERQIELHTSRYPASVEEDGLVLVPNYRDRLAADRVVSKPPLTGPGLRGLSADREGFVPTDVHARVPGAPGVFAAGDATTFPVKQGGIATQQADAAAEAIAALAGADVDPQPFRPVLRGVLLTGSQLRFMRSEVAEPHGDRQEVAESALWWPPSMIAGRYLSPYLGLRHGALEVGQDDAVCVEVNLARWADGASGGLRA